MSNLSEEEIIYRIKELIEHNERFLSECCLDKFSENEFIRDNKALNRDYRPI